MADKAHIPSAGVGPSDDMRMDLSIADQLGYCLRVAQDAAADSLQRSVANFRPGRLALLIAIFDRPGLNQTELAEMAKRDKSTVTPAVVQLERAGLIRRERIDQRTYGLYLTPKGDGFRQELLQAAQLHDNKLTTILGADTRETLIQLLRKLTVALNEI